MKEEAWEHFKEVVNEVIVYAVDKDVDGDYWRTKLMQAGANLASSNQQPNKPMSHNSRLHAAFR